MRTAFIMLLALTAIAVPTHTETAMMEGVVLSQMVTVTAYTRYESCSNRPDCLTASGKPVVVGHAAMSRDLERKGLRFGDKIHLVGIGFFILEDRMHRRWRNRVDIFMDDYRDAKNFGIRRAVMVASREKGRVSA